MKKLNNPFLTIGYQSPDYFCDRNAESKQIIQNLQGGNNVTLISPRRLGKSALIKHVFYQMKQHDPSVFCFYMDIYPTKNLEQFVQLFAKEVLGKLESEGEKVLKKALTIFQSLRPVISIDPYSGSPEFSLSVESSMAQQSLESILDYLERSGKRCYVAIDEFQQILSYDDKNTEAFLRSKVQFLQNVCFIFAGSEQHLMSEMFMSPERPFYRSTSTVEIHEIDKDLYVQFANRVVRSKDRRFTVEAFDYLYDQVDGQTWFVQKLLSLLYFSDDKLIDKACVNRIVDLALQEQDSSFKYLCHHLSQNQVSLLHAIAMEGRVYQPYGKDFIRKYRLSTPSSLKATLKTLVEQQLVYSCLDNSFIVYDRFFHMWLRRM